MKVVIFGATGGIGKWTVPYALKKGHDITVYVRDASKLKDLNPSVKVVEGAIADYEKVLATLQGNDAVIWCVGIEVWWNNGQMEILHAHNELLRAMREAGVKRLIEWGTPSVKSDDDKSSLLTIIPPIGAGIVFRRTKKELVAIGESLKTSAADLDWTMVRVLFLRDTPATGKVGVSFGDVSVGWTISREDVAVFMVDQLESNDYIRKMPIIGNM